MIPVALAAQLSGSAETRRTFAIFEALLARETLEAWLVLRLSALVVAVSAVILGEVAVDPLR